jgi:hypothetical protein
LNLFLKVALTKKQKIRNLSFILVGVILLVLKQKYNGPYLEIIKSYLGNFSISFAVYFIVQFNDHLWKTNKVINALIAIVVVSLFELTDGFGVMTNVYDKIDLLINLAGILLALALDSFTARFTLENKQ